MTTQQMRDAAVALYREHFHAAMRGDDQGAAALKLRADYLNIAGVTGYRMPVIESLAMGVPSA